ncbi:MAG: hypothetical protein MHM6MM_003572 [Cercozoa sp. M6MM]
MSKGGGGAATLMRYVRLRVPAGQAKPSPALGQALGPLGLNMMMFCKSFNERTQHFRAGVPLRVKLSAFSDRTFTFTTKNPPTSWLIKQAAGIEKGAKDRSENVGSVDVRQVYEIAKLKLQDDGMDHLSLRQMCDNIVHNCYNMGVSVTK